MLSADDIKSLPPWGGHLAIAARHPLPALLCLFLFVAINIDFPGVPSWHDGQRLLQIVALIPALLMCAWGFSRTNPLIAWRCCPGWMRGTMALAALLGFCSSLSADLTRWALLEWSMTCGLVLSGMGVAASCRAGDDGRDVALVGVFYFLALAYCFKAVLAYVLMFAVGPDYRLAFSVEELFPGFSNVRFFGHVQTMLLPLLVLPAMWWTRQPLPRAMLLLVPTLWWTLAIASGTRGSWFALLIGAAVALALGGAAGRTWLRWQLGTMLVGGLCYVIFILGLPDLMDKPASFLHRSQDLISLRGRELLWQLSLELISAHAWLGIGPMHFAQRLSIIASHPHNAPLQWMVEWGLPAALLMISVVAAAGLGFARRVWHCCHSDTPLQDQMINVVLLAALTGAAAQAMVDGVLVMPVSQMLLVLLCGWAWGRNLGTKTLQAVTPRTQGVSLLAVGFLICMLVCAWPEIIRLEARLQEHLLTYPQGPTPRLLPRFWIHGWIP